MRTFGCLAAPAGLKAPVTIDEILDLCELDGGPRNPRLVASQTARETSKAPAA